MFGHNKNTKAQYLKLKRESKQEMVEINNEEALHLDKIYNDMMKLCRLGRLQTITHPPVDIAHKKDSAQENFIILQNEALNGNLKAKLKIFEYELEYHRVDEKKQYSQIRNLYAHTEHGSSPRSKTTIIQDLKKLVKQTGDPSALIILAKAYALRNRKQHPSHKTGVNLAKLVVGMTIFGLPFLLEMYADETYPDARRALYCLIIATILTDKPEVKALAKTMHSTIHIPLNDEACSVRFHPKSLKEFIVKNIPFQNFLEKHLSLESRLAFGVKVDTGLDTLKLKKYNK